MTPQLVAEAYLRHAMSELHFVEWDRFISHSYSTGDGQAIGFGWIARPHGTRSHDFVLVETWSTTPTPSFTTSSAKFTPAIMEALGLDPDVHVDCRKATELLGQT